MALTEPQIRRYSRHVLLPDVGGIGQSRLLAATVELDFSTDEAATTVAATYLAAAGIGTLVLRNLPDPTALVARLSALNPDVRFPDAPEGDAPPGTTYRVPRTGYHVPGTTYLGAEALVQGGAAACELIHRIARGAA